MERSSMESSEGFELSPQEAKEEMRQNLDALIQNLLSIVKGEVSDPDEMKDKATDALHSAVSLRENLKHLQ